jgi:NAD-dependent DNA ligase
VASIQYIYEDEVACPRCNADSQLRIEDQADICIIVQVCKYCRFRKVQRMTTRRALQLEKGEQKLLDKLNSGDKIGETYKILARLKKVRRERELQEIGIRRKHGRRKRAK